MTLQEIKQHNTKMIWKSTGFELTSTLAQKWLLVYLVYSIKLRHTCKTRFSFSHAAILSAVKKSSSSTPTLEPTLAFDAVAADVTATVDVVDVIPGPRCWG